MSGIGIDGDDIWIEASNATRALLHLEPGMIVSTPTGRLVVKALDPCPNRGPDVDACRIRLRRLVAHRSLT